MSPKHEFQIHQGKILTPSFFALLLLSLVGFYYIGVRFLYGIGAVANLSDGYPWGLWITYDVATGTALACGGYAMALIIYIMNNWHYHPLIRSAMLTSLFGYGLAGFSVMVDLGRYWNSYNFFVFDRWQTNSVMFEVALCVMLYNLVLFIEVSPAFLERLIHSEKERFKTIKNMARWIYPKLDKALVFFVVLGITLPTMHQSSLGSMLIIAGEKLHPIWHTEFLPLLFLINCVYIGYSMVIFESTASSLAFGRPLESEQISGLSKVIPYLTGVWLVIRLGDLYYRGNLGVAFNGDFYSWMFIAELAFTLLGAHILMYPKFTVSPRMTFFSAVFLTIGGGWYRFNVYLIGFNPGDQWTYFPALPEFMITVGLVSFEILAYTVLVKLFPFMPKVHTKA